MVEDYYGTSQKRVSDKVKRTYPAAARLIETCWELQEEGANAPREETLNFWIYPTQKYPDISRAYAMLNQIIDQVPGAIIYVEEACRKFVRKFPTVNPNRPFSDEMIQLCWPSDNKRRIILRELEKACEQALNPSFSFDDKKGGGGGGGGGGPQQSISAVASMGGKSSGGNG